MIDARSARCSQELAYETQLVAIPLSVDHVHPYDILAMNGASAALMISDIPVPTPVGAVRIGKVDGNFVVNPREEDLLDENTDLDLIVAGTEDAILMVEAGANEIPEAEILDALDIAHARIKKLCALQRELAAKVGKAKLEVVVPRSTPSCSSRSLLAWRGARRRHPGGGQARAPGGDQGRRGAVIEQARAPGDSEDAYAKDSAQRPSGPSTSSRRRSSASGSPCTRSAPTGARRTRSATSRSRSA